MNTRHEVLRIEELLHKDHYTTEEAAYVLDMAPSVIHSAIMRHELAAFVVDHHVLSIRRQDLIDWLRRNAKI